MTGVLEVRVEAIHELAELDQVEELQMLVWGVDRRLMVPTTLMSTIAASGGILLGAFSGEMLAGFVLGLLAQRHGRLYHASHMLGIHPGYQGRGLGTILKQHQRDCAGSRTHDLDVRSVGGAQRPL